MSLPTRATTLVRRGGWLSAIVATAFAVPNPSRVVGYAAIVDAAYTGIDGVPVGGTPTFRTIGSAITNLPVNGATRAIVFIRNARYREKLTIERPRVTLLGESRDGAILTYDAAADTPTPTGGTYGTRGSFTLRIVAPDFRAENMTIENSFDYPANAAKPDGDRTKFKNQQAVALLADLGSDRAVFENVKITGYQDTLFPNSGRSYFHKCEIWGHVDFIFGAGQAVFDDCAIVSRDRSSSTNNGYVTASSTKADQPFGFLFIHSRLKKERPEMASNTVALGRPWHPFADAAVNSAVAFVDCWMDDHIGARRWDRMASVDSTGTRIWYEPWSARFHEFNSTGPGAARSAIRPALSSDEARLYTPANVLGGWVPAFPTRTAPEPAILLWAKGAPGALGDSDVDKPTITPFPARSGTVNGTGVVIFPGGGYTHLALDHEGAQVAAWLNELGITAFVVTYRLGPRYHHPAMLQDARRAVRLVRANAKRWELTPDRIGVMGFSAGGHMAATVATHFDAGNPTDSDPIERASSRPDFAALLYPVITMSHPFAHQGSRDNLLGADPSPSLVRLLSDETQVTPRTPPTFIVATTDDATVPVENSEMFYDALRTAKVPAEIHLFESGHHGFGLAPADPELSVWRSLFETWMRRHGLLPP